MQMYNSRQRAHVSIEKQGRNISAHAKRCRCPCLFDICTFPHLHNSFERVLVHLQDYITYLCIYSRVCNSMFICVNIIQLRYAYGGLAPEDTNKRRRKKLGLSCTANKIRFSYSQKWNCAASFGKIGGPIVGIYKSLTDTWMHKLGTRPRSLISKNNCFEFSVQCVRYEYCRWLIIWNSEH